MIYDNFQSLGLRLLTKYGQDVTLQAKTTGAYSPTTGIATVATTTTTRKAVIFDANQGVSAFSGELIQAGDKYMIMDGTASVARQDHVSVGGIIYKIESVKDNAPAGTITVYELLLRGAS